MNFQFYYEINMYNDQMTKVQKGLFGVQFVLLIPIYKPKPSPEIINIC